MPTVLASIATLATVLGGVALATPAAATVDATPSRLVSYRDLDLGTPAGRRALDRRVRLAVRAVCPESGVLDTDAALCRAQSQARAVAALSRAGVTL